MRVLGVRFVCSLVLFFSPFYPPSYEKKNVKRSTLFSVANSLCPPPTSRQVAVAAASAKARTERGIFSPATAGLCCDGVGLAKPNSTKNEAFVARSAPLYPGRSLSSSSKSFKKEDGEKGEVAETCASSCVDAELGRVRSGCSCSCSFCGCVRAVEP